MIQPRPPPDALSLLAAMALIVAAEINIRILRVRLSTVSGVAPGASSALFRIKNEDSIWIDLDDGVNRIIFSGTRPLV
jgi:hypothetical protein